MSSRELNSTKVSLRDKAFYRQVASLHIDGIKQGFLPQLGLSFMTLLYEAIDNSSSSVLLVEHDGDNLAGFVSGSIGMKHIYYRLLRRFPRLFMVMFPSLIRPKRMKRIMEILRYSRQKGSTNLENLPEFELLSIAVTPAARGSGCADRLYKRLVEYCQNHGIDAFKIIVGDSLAPAHSFYRRMGAVPKTHIELHSGQGSLVYVQSVS